MVTPALYFDAEAFGRANPATDADKTMDTEGGGTVDLTLVSPSSGSTLTL
jgi:hypothetical protein